ncbi:hypothetical protein FGO68_gene6367 [Halteria grandinella]|uniref:Uncharacterized protein n=1 Tax=Halteria grandinella TaxID=5974 RepID=A0A8J8T6D8_HALGN|nr:hypothetical protein FGO68_gene6367 [Halteria grandinella]
MCPAPMLSSRRNDLWRVSLQPYYCCTLYFFQQGVCNCPALGTSFREEMYLDESDPSPMKMVSLDFTEFMKVSPLQVPSPGTWQGLSPQGFPAIEYLCPYTKAGKVCRFPAQVVPSELQLPFQFLYLYP